VDLSGAVRATARANSRHGRPARTLHEVVARIDARELPVGDTSRPAAVTTGISQDSRTVRPGDLYVALAGERAHGARFLAQAASRGAVAALVDGPGLALLDGAPRLPTIVAADLRRRLGPLASWIYGDPSRELDLVAVTGTNGKTSTAYLLHAGMTAAGHRAGLLSGVEILGPGWSRPAARTTVEACDLQRTLAELVDAGVTAAPVEVSSHGIAMHRVDGTVFGVAVFTNLGRDHLDMHGDMGTYFATKAKLFEPQWCERAVIGVDDGWGRRLAAQADVPVITYSAAGRAADWTARDIQATAAGTSFHVSGPGIDGPVRLRLLGDYQVDNALAALAALTATGSDPVAAVAGLEGLRGIPGRLERVEAGQRFAAFVDYAHNEAGQARVFPFLRSLTRGRLLIVRGATGDRDAGKRTGMGRAAAELADVMIVTDESPHSEQASAIRDVVAAGARSAGHARVYVEPDRGRAFDLAVGLAEPDDVVVVCGRGHEATQIAATGNRSFDDRIELRRALLRVAERRPGPG